MNKAVIVALNLTLIACNVALLYSRRNIAANIASTAAIVTGVIAIATTLLS